MPSDKRARQRAGRAARMAELQNAQRRRRRNTRVIPLVLAAVVVAVIGIFLTSSNHSSSKPKPKPKPTASPTTTFKGATPCPKFAGPNPHVTSFSQPPPMCITPGKTYTATFNTSEGNLAVAFDTTKTPQTANNFIVLALYHYYDGTRMFRTDTSIGIIQGGSPHTEDSSDPGPGYNINDEGSGFTYSPGDLVMARTSAPNSASAQYFFCVTAACSGLNSQGNYVVFAHVTSGLDVLQKILSLNVDQNNGLGGAPSRPVTVNSVTVSQS